ncbi:MAG: hypothetical protein ACI97A_002835 [Planctomycetota bacterium]|jgi:hypothetical protein
MQAVCRIFLGANETETQQMATRRELGKMPQVNVGIGAGDQRSSLMVNPCLFSSAASLSRWSP